MPERPEDIDKEAVELFKTEDEKVVEALHEAFKINRAVELLLGYIEKGFLTDDTPLMEALEKLEKKKFELIGKDPDDAEEVDDKEGDSK